MKVVFMQAAPIPVNEEARLKTVLEYDPTGTFETDAYMPVLELAHKLFEVPTAFIAFLHRDTQVFPVRLGLDLCGTDRSISFCAHAVAQEEMLLVLDATLDPRFADNPLVVGEPYIRFYAGMPLVSPSGHAIGTFCIVDDKPHNAFDEVKQSLLRHLAAMLLDKLELRRLEAAHRAGQVRFENIAATSPDGIICADAAGHITFWNAAAGRMFGYPADDAVGQPLDLIVPERMRRGHDGGFRRVVNLSASRSVGHTVELTALRQDGSEFPVELSLSMWHQEESPCFGAILRDISERRANEERLLRLAHHDPLTELPNRTILHQRLEQLARVIEPAALLLVDLDGFKTVNDDLGHQAGDDVLREVAARLLACVRGTDTVARIGGDEFALLLLGVDSDWRAADVADEVIRAIARPIACERHTVTIGASVGSALHPRDGAMGDELRSSADFALYRAKAEGRHCHQIFTAELRRARAYDSELRRAYDHEEFKVFYQPQIRLADGAMVGAEALLRWQHPEDGLLSPAAFMPSLEQRPISAEVGRWVLRTACAQAAVWRASGLPRFRMGVNLFGSQFQSGRLEQDVAEALTATGLSADALELEITENIILRHDKRLLTSLHTIRDRGVGIAFDDYGTGYASFSMLKRFPLTRLKVDQSFVRGLCSSPEDRAIVEAILHLGRCFGFAVIAEGVEAEQQARRLREMGCDEAQGFLYGRPMSAAELAQRFGLSAICSGSFRSERTTEAAD
ncbi:MAG: putative bifunctional diguanylate cyclase/phosphodiesterase [Janthinobacterium lividum]